MFINNRVLRGYGGYCQRPPAYDSWPGWWPSSCLSSRTSCYEVIEHWSRNQFINYFLEQSDSAVSACLGWATAAGFLGFFLVRNDNSNRFILSPPWRHCLSFQRYSSDCVYWDSVLRTGLSSVHEYIILGTLGGCSGFWTAVLRGPPCWFAVDLHFFGFTPMWDPQILDGLHLPFYIVLRYQTSALL